MCASCDMFHDLQTPLVRVMTVPGTGSIVTAQHCHRTQGPAVSTALLWRCFYPICPISRSWWGCLARGSQQATMHCLRASELTLPRFSSCRLLLAYSSLRCLPAVFAKSRGAQMLPFATLGICVMSQVPPPDTCQPTVYQSFWQTFSVMAV